MEKRLTDEELGIDIDAMNAAAIEMGGSSLLAQNLDELRAERIRARQEEQLKVVARTVTSGNTTRFTVDM